MLIQLRKPVVQFLLQLRFLFAHGLLTSSGDRRLQGRGNFLVRNVQAAKLARLCQPVLPAELQDAQFKQHIQAMQRVEEMLQIVLVIVGHGQSLFLLSAISRTARSRPLPFRPPLSPT